MKNNIFLLTFLLVLIGCQASGGGAGSDLVSGHTPVENKFTLTTSLNANYNTSQAINFTLTFPKPITVSGGTPSITATIGTSPVIIPMSSVGTSSMIFSYTIAPGDRDVNGVQVSPTLNKGGATITYDTFETGTEITIPDLSSVRVNLGSAPVTSNITPASLAEDLPAIVTLSYTDAESDLATSCSLSGVSNIVIAQACACSSGVCTVGVKGNNNYNGAASFNYSVSSNSQASNSSTANLTITSVPDLPVANNITPAAFNRNTQKIVTLSYSDGDGDLANACSVSSPTNVTVTEACVCASGVCTVGVTGTINYSGSASFSYNVTANGDVSNSATANLTILNSGVTISAPVASNITPPAFNEDTESVITLSYTDANNDLATACALSSPTNVSVTTPCSCSGGGICTVGVTGNSNYNGVAGFGYTVTAGGQSSNIATATLSINPVEDAPVAANITPPGFPRNTQSIITLSYTDIESDQATICTLSGTTNVSVTQPCACSSGTCTVGVTGAINYSGAAGFSYTVTANGQISNSATASLAISGTSPAANNISPGTFNEDTQSIITLSYTDPNSDLATNCSVSNLNNVSETQACACAAGVCTVGITGSLNYFGAAGFNYSVTANGETSNSATATLAINNVEDAPVTTNIVPPSFNKNAQSIITLAYTDADSDQATTCSISGETNVSVTQACGCSAGVCTVGVTGSLNYYGTASFTYSVTANSAVSNSSTATFTILNADNAPVANNITPASFNEDFQSIITLSYTDSDADQATTCALSGLTNVTETQACVCAVGTCTVGVTGTSNHVGAASFNYTVTANGASSNSATASLTIVNVDDAPVANAMTPPAFNENTQSIITLSYSDLESDLAATCAISGETNVTLSQACACAAGTCTVGVTGTSNYSGAASFNFTVTANSATSNSAMATLTINNLDNSPVASNITPPAFNEDVQSTISLSYTDADSDLATICSLSGLTNVTVTQACSCSAGNCTVGVTGNADYNGAASFTYTVTANSAASNSATATLTINNVDDAPVAANVTPAAFNENTQSIITLSYSDVDPDQATSCSVISPVNVTVTQGCACTAGTCTVGVTGATNYFGSASFNYTVTANSAVSNAATANLTITDVNNAPVANNITPPSFNEDIQSVITLSYTDSDSDPAATCAITGQANVSVTQGCACTSGTCTVGVTGSANHNGSANFTYTVTANSQTSNTATATLSINPVDDAPVALNITPPAFNANSPSTINLSYTDVEGDFAASCAISGLTNVSVTSACTCTLGSCSVGVQGTTNYSGPASFTYTVTSNSLTSNSATASLTINAADTAPVANNINPSAGTEDVQSIINLSYSDGESDLASVCTISLPNNVSVTQPCACTLGTCTVGVTGTADYNGSAGFSYTVTANGQTSNTATASFTIDPVNDNPVISAITNKTTPKNTNASGITFTITDVDSTLACTSARLAMTSTNTAIVANTSVTWSGTAPNCSATIAPVTNAIGTTNITFTVNDGSGGMHTSNFQLTVQGVILVWADGSGNTISSYSFGSPGGNTTATVYVKNNGNITSSTLSFTDDGGHASLSQSNSCTTVAAGATCPVTLNWSNGGAGGFRQEIYTVSADGFAPTLTVSGTK